VKGTTCDTNQGASGFADGGFGPFVAHDRQKKLFQAGALGRNELIQLFERALRSIIDAIIDVLRNLGDLVGLDLHADACPAR